jgi:hypothetical protein
VEQVANWSRRRLNAAVASPLLPGNFRSLPQRTVCHGVEADVTRPGSLLHAIGERRIILSGLGISSRQEVCVLHAGAQTIIQTKPERIIWLGAIGTGAPAGRASWLTRSILRLVLGCEIDDKVAADAAIIAAGGTVFHAGALSNKASSPTRKTIRLTDVRREVFPSGVSQASVAALMIDEAEAPRFMNETVAPVS